MTNLERRNILMNSVTHMHEAYFLHLILKLLLIVASREFFSS